MRPDDDTPRRTWKVDLVGYIEIAARAGVHRKTVTGWRYRYERGGRKDDAPFPEPVAELRVGPVWFWSEVEDWLRNSGRAYDVNLPIEQVVQSKHGVTRVQKPRYET